jgi:kynurenine formamidase
VEGLTNLETLPEDEIFFVGAPVALKGADGFPLRALGIEF